jgi:hypothetical protein
MVDSSDPAPATLPIRRGPVVLVAAILAILTVAGVFWVPGPQTPATDFSGEIVAGCDGCAAVMHNETLPAGSEVNIQWSDQSGGFVTFSVIPPGFLGGADPCTWSNASAGACSFVSVGGSYAFYAGKPTFSTEGIQLVVYSGSYSR